MSNRTTLNSALATKPGCLTLKELEQLADDPSPKHPHVAECARCQAELAMLKAFESDSLLPDEGAAVAWISSEMERRLNQIKNPGRDFQASSTARLSWLNRLLGTGNARWLVPVAAILVIATVSVILLRPSREPDLRAAAGSGPVVYRSLQIDVVAPIGELAQPPKSLQWKAFAGAAQYKVAVMEVDHHPLWMAEVHDISVTIPDVTRAKLLPGKPVLWQVTALDSQGRPLAVSQVQRFSVARKSSESDGGLLPR